MPIPHYHEEPPRWAEEYTDIFNLNIHTKNELVKLCIEKSTEQFETETDYKIIKDGLIVVDNQLLVSELKEQLYGFEIVYRHTHIPRLYGSK